MSGCEKCGKEWSNGDCSTTSSRRALCAQAARHAGTDRLLPSLRSAREKLCVAQTEMAWPGHRAQIGEAIATIDRIGIWYCGADWSKHNLPTTELDSGDY